MCRGAGDAADSHAMITLDGKRVLVVGASSGIGRAVAIQAVREGAKVVFAARRTDALADAVEEAGGGLPVDGDVRRVGDCERIVQQAVAALGELDLVFIAA